MKNKAAQALGRLAKGKPKTRSPEWLKVQQENARRARDAKARRALGGRATE